MKHQLAPHLVALNCSIHLAAQLLEASSNLTRSTHCISPSCVHRALPLMLPALLANGSANSNLYVSGLPPSTSEEMCRQLFREFGEAAWQASFSLQRAPCCLTQL